MFLLRLVLLFILFVMIRRIFRSWRAAVVKARTKSDQQVHRKAEGDEDYSDLTEQGIDDADFEEIP